MKKIGIACALVAFAFVGCESKTQSGALGGAGVGALAGGLITHSAGGAIIGGAIGAAGGALVGAALDAQDRDKMRNSPQTLHKIDKGEQLSIGDVKEMSKNGLNDNVIIHQIQSTNSHFQLSADQIVDLKNSGVSQRVIDYMIQTGS
jgi:uncharacterized protein YcfJ